MEQNTIMKDVNGDDFIYRTVDSELISVDSTGYIFTPDGQVVIVLDNEHHDKIFSDYYNTYMANKKDDVYDVFTAAMLLIQTNHICYLGVKTVGNNSSNEDEEYYGMGAIFLPTPLNLITEPQKKLLRSLIVSNKEIDGNRDKFLLNFYNAEEELSYDTVVSFLGSLAVERK